MSGRNERTYIMIKPDGVQRGLVGEIIKRFEQRGYKLGAMKLYQASEELLKKHYSDLVSKPFFPDLLSYMLSGPVTCMVWEVCHWPPHENEPRAWQRIQLSRPSSSNPHPG